MKCVIVSIVVQRENNTTIHKTGIPPGVNQIYLEINAYIYYNFYKMMKWKPNWNIPTLNKLMYKCLKNVFKTNNLKCS